MKDYGTQNLDWLPVKLPENVKFIFSVANDSQVFAEVQKKITDSAALLPVSIIAQLKFHAYTNKMNNAHFEVL